MLFNQTIQLIELTKELERVTVDTLTSTYALGHTYQNAGNWIQGAETNSNTEFTKFDISTDARYYKNIAQGKLDLVQINAYYQETSSDPIYNPTTLIVKLNGEEIYNQLVPAPPSTGGKPENGAIFGSIDLSNKVGTLTVEYYSERGSLPPTWARLVYTIQAIAYIPNEKPRSVTDVINRVLDVGVSCRTLDEKPFYKLDPVYAEMFSKVPAPEYTFTRATLYEVLLEIGTTNNLGAIPKLKWNFESNTASIISFTLTGTDEVYTLPPDATGYLSLEHTTDAESFCGGIESYVENMVNSIDQSQGTVTEPSRYGFQTLRGGENDYFVDDDHAQLNMQFPIYQVNKVEQGAVSADSGNIGDITPYLFENAEYATLSPYVGSFPKSKKYALRYTQGSNVIDCFTVKAEDAKILGIDSQEYAAVEIAKQQKSDLQKTSSIANFAYRVNYTPIVGARVRQYKPYRNSHPRNNILYYNQAANVVESSYYGHNMKYYLARIGNDLYIVTYKFQKWSSLPKIGQLFADKYISQVDILAEQDFIVATLYLTPNFNRLNQNVGINAARRQYEVSERQSVKRDINRSEFILLAHTSQPSEAPSITDRGILLAYYFTFNPTKDTDRSPHNAIVQGFEKSADGGVGSAVQAPILRAVSAMAFGNSLLFKWDFKDNYGAGQKAKAFTSSRKSLRDVPYGNYYGRFYWLSMKYYNYAIDKKKETWANQISEPASVKHGLFDKLPSIDTATANPGATYIDFSSNPIAVDKDSREQINLTLQYHHQAVDESIVMGSELCAKNRMVYTGKPIRWSIVLLPYRLNQLRNIVNLDGAAILRDKADTLGISSYKIGRGTRYIKLTAPTNTTGQTYKSWAIINGETNELFLGDNIELAPGAKAPDIYINF